MCASSHMTLTTCTGSLYDTFRCMFTVPCVSHARTSNRMFTGHAFANCVTPFHMHICITWHALVQWRI